LFSGEGAAGKSTVQLHLSAAHVLGRDWLGTMPTPGPAIFIDAEDDEDVMHWRLAAIAKHYDVTFAKLIKAGLHLISLAGHAVLATVNRGKLEPTARYKCSGRRPWERRLRKIYLQSAPGRSPIRHRVFAWRCGGEP
jgi:RecA-family ATPase